MKLAYLAATLAALPGIAEAQAYKCSVPANIARPRPDLASKSEPQRVLPIGGYTLAVTWAAQYCHGNARNPSARLECGSGNRFGFTLHGLWPDGVGKDWPQYCTAATLLPQPLIKQHLCSTPSAQLLQHEWSKHGTCMGTTPAAYFARSTGLYAKLRYPDMNALSRRPLKVGGFAAAMAAANPGLPASAIRVTANKQGWLDELWLCLDKSFAYEHCKAGTGGLPGNAALKIWRGPR
ncbi:MAG: ribonuclease [Sphingomonas bacterium]|uniref:ribonuclease T2 family protein n=1 Tax=Sphingomonas bacterium TaxID=1895847 RepID=UPI00261FDB29|nr:ribonuclease T [Sphingomonas bacterium]MDB5703609.1 ribonuclease [Sphingomonas bacterium]